MFQDELRTLDEESRRVRTAVAGTLTAQELRIAQTVAGGATNKEVAARLFLSVKTVEVHLGHIYAKLGIHSRTELVALLLRPDEFPSGGPGTVDGRTWDPLVAAQ
jgi:DNA-binding CsgD family transcriptional regulator